VMECEVHKLLNISSAAYVEREEAWRAHDRRGRWVVIEPGVGRLLTGERRSLRRYVDAVTPKRGRRFSSLSRARAFARQVGGTVQRWRRQMPQGTWRREDPWDRARQSMDWGLLWV
jgi:hypothetical protein